MKELITRIYKNDTYKEVLVDKEVPDWFYSNPDSDYSEWKLIELPSTDTDRVTKEIMRLEKQFLFKLPLDLVTFILCFWKEELLISQEEIDYTLFKNLPGKEVDEYERAITDYIQFGTLEKAIPIGHDEFGNWMLISCEDGSVWVEDTDFLKNIRLSDSLFDFLSGKIHRFSNNAPFN